LSLVQVDHLVVAAASLEQGAAWCEATLGVPAGPGGRHTQFGTHNRLLKIASDAFPAAYLEIIAIDPAGAAPAGKRWFALDDPAMQARLAQAPQLVHFVARSNMLDMHRWGLITVGHQPGDPVRAFRDTPGGRLEWEILVRPDGAFDCGGALPTLIQWRGPHPTEAMPDSGVTLTALQWSGVPERARQVLRLRGMTVGAEGAPALRATFSTPHGDVTIES
jgi:hypothetical protein